MYKKTFVFVIISSLLFAACSSQTPAPDPSLIQLQTLQPVIFDTDMAHEDMISALYSLVAS